MTLTNAEITRLLFNSENPQIAVERLDALRASLVSATLQMDTLLAIVPNITKLRDDLWNMQEEIETIKMAISNKTEEN